MRHRGARAREAPLDAPDESERRKPPDAAGDVDVVEVAALAVLVPLGAWTVVVQAAQLGAWRFAATAWTGVSVAATLGLLGSVWAVAHVRSRPPDRAAWAALGRLALLGALAAAFTVAFPRWNIDDLDYLPNAVYALDHPDAPLEPVVRWLHVPGGEPVRSFHYAVAYTWEYMQASASHAFGVDLLGLRYVAAPAAWAFASVFCLYLAARSFGRAVPVAALGLALLLLLTLAERPRSPGNWAFTRLFQGKGVLLFALLPLATGLLLRFLQGGRATSLAALVALSVFATATTPSAGFLLPALWGCGVAAWGASELWERRRPEGAAWTPSRLAARRVAAAAAALVWPVLWSLVLKAHTPRALTDNDGLVNALFPNTFWGQLGLLTDPTRPASLLAGLGFAGLAAAHLQGRGRALLVALVGAEVLVLLNPAPAWLLIEHVVTSNTYWRLFYLFPWTIVLALGCAALLERSRRWRRAPRIAATGALVALALAPHGPALLDVPAAGLGRASALRYSEARFARPAAHEVFVWARRVADHLPRPTVVLAPRWCSGGLALVDGRHEHVAIRYYNTRFFLRQAGRPEAGPRRETACRYLDRATAAPRRREASRSAVLRVVRAMGGRTQAVVARADHPDAAFLERSLQEAGFVARARVRDHVLHVRTTAE